MKDFRGPLPLTDADFARIRANVMAEVRPKRTWVAFRWAFAMLTAAAFVGVVSYKSLQVTTTTIVLPPPTRVEAVASVAVVAPPTAAEAAASTQKPVRRPVTRRTKPEVIPTQLRIEIQTSDPDIRIIWLPNHYDPKSEEQS